MRIKISQVLVAVAVLTTSVSCSRFVKVKKPAPGVVNKSEEFNLSVDAADYSKSKYCGDVRPETAKDPTPPYTFEDKFISDKLASADGFVGWIHGAVPSYKQYLFTYRKVEPGNPMAFFQAEQFSLVGATPEIWKQFEALNRHDKVRLKGTLLDNKSPIKHLIISEITVLKAYDKSTDNEYNFDVAKLKGVQTFRVFGQIHALVASEAYGYAIVLEKDNFMMPIAVKSKHAAVAKGLFKGDIVDVNVSVVEGKNGRPPHFQTDENFEEAITIVDPLINCHGTTRAVEGHLVKFDKSPAISLDVYAVRLVDGNGIGRNMTFFPSVPASEDSFGEIFMAISAKAKKAWDEAEEAPGVVRNYNEKKSIHVVANGMINVVSTEQANAQVYLNSADDIEFKVVVEPAKVP